MPTYIPNKILENSPVYSLQELNNPCNITNLTDELEKSGCACDNCREELIKDEAQDIPGLPKMGGGQFTNQIVNKSAEQAVTKNVV